MLVSGELRHDGNPVMTWNAASAVLDTDPAGNRKVTKRRATGRVDGIVAAVMAAGMSLKAEPDKKYQVLFF
jgi:phage terminase large subunit-like protein